MLCGVIYIVLSQFTPFCKLVTIELNIPSNKRWYLRSSQKWYLWFCIPESGQELKQSEKMITSVFWFLSEFWFYR